MEKLISKKIWMTYGVTKMSSKSLIGRSPLAAMLLLLMFFSIFSVLTPMVKASNAVPYDNIGTEWTRNPNLILSDGSWDSRVWQWSSSSLELYHGDDNNYVNWIEDGKVDSQAQDWAGGPYIASNFDQGYEKYENEIYDLSTWGNWNDRSCSLRVEGSVTIFDGIGYTGNSLTLTSDVQDLDLYNWNSKASSLKLTLGSRVTLYSIPDYSGDSITFVAPSYQPPDLKIADKNSITLEGVVNNWYTDTWTGPGWTGVKFDVFAVEDRYSNTGKTLMLEMYLLRDGANLAWSAYNFIQGCSGNEREGFRGPPFQSAYNYLVALDAFSGIANMTVYPGNVAKWTIDVKALMQRACDHDWGVAPSNYHLDIEKLNIVKVSFTVESAYFGSPVRTGCTLNRLRLAYTDAHASTAIVRGMDNRIYFGTVDSSPNSWVQVPSGLTCDSPAGIFAGNELHIVVRSIDNATIWHSYINTDTGFFSGWTQLSGITPSAPTFATNGTHLCLLVRGADNGIYYRFYNLTSHTWKEWQLLPGEGRTSDAPAAVILNGNLHVVVRSTDGFNIWHSYLELSTGVFSGWTLVGEFTHSAPALVACTTRNEIVLVVRGLDNSIYRNTWSGSGWTGWVALPGGLTCDGPGASVIGQELQIIVQGVEGLSIWKVRVDLATGSFSGWTLLNGLTPSKPILVS